MKRLSTLITRTTKPNDQKIVDLQQEVKNSPIRIPILGPRGSGKTSFLYRSYFKYNVNRPDTHFDVMPTSSHNVETISYQSNQFELWDFAEISSCLNYLNEQTRVIIYLIDSTAYDREVVSSKSKENMMWLLETYQKILKNAIIITVATKQDTQPPMDIQDIGHLWVSDEALMHLLNGHDWRIFSCNNLTASKAYIVPSQQYHPHRH
ncbi:P-loop containing nucleoside triphosphate hydrolase protein [Parasitella parasitica]|nr:P-loop containing nucleoside triphosphate hydrolase protein [Parasitella parasitica]